jgi:hypothetical protein
LWSWPIFANCSARLGLHPLVLLTIDAEDAEDRGDQLVPVVGADGLARLLAERLDRFVISAMRGRMLVLMAGGSVSSGRTRG